LHKIFVGDNLSEFKKEDSVELETLMSLIRGCEYMGMLPYAKAKVIEPQSKDSE